MTPLKSETQELVLRHKTHDLVYVQAKYLCLSGLAALGLSIAAKVKTRGAWWLSQLVHTAQFM